MVDDNKPLPEDIEFSKQIVRILLLLQPLKNINNEFGEGRFFLEPKTEIHPEDTALSLMTKPAAALIEDNESVMRTVFEIFAQENDWDYLDGQKSTTRTEETAFNRGSGTHELSKHQESQTSDKSVGHDSITH